MPFRLEKVFRFEAAHHLPNHDGKCKRMHGHSFVGKLIVEDYELVTSGPKAGMLIDYGDLSAAVKPLVDGFLDHFCLNDTTGLENPTSEELAKWIFFRLKPDLPQLVCVRVEETCTSAAEYRPTKQEELTYRTEKILGPRESVNDY